MICASCLRRLARPSTPCILVQTARRPSRLPQLEREKNYISRHLSTLSARLRAPSLHTQLASSRTQLQSQNVLPFNNVLQTRSFASSVALSAPRDTMKHWTHLIRKRRHGFLSRTRTRTGRRMLKRRRAKGRQSLSH